jgi:hypothetical protein
VENLPANEQHEQEEEKIQVLDQVSLLNFFTLFIGGDFSN